MNDFDTEFGRDPGGQADLPGPALVIALGCVFFGLALSATAGIVWLALIAAGSCS